MKRGISTPTVLAGIVVLWAAGPVAAQPCQPYWAAPPRTLTVLIPEFSDALITFDDGSGPALYVGGTFNLSPGQPPTFVHGVARWNGRNWAMLSDGMPHGPNPAGPWMRVLDDGAGPRLYAWGYYDPPKPGLTFWIVFWDGVRWQPAPTSLYSALPKLSADLGFGPRIYGFQYAQQGTVSTLVQWTGSDWVPLGGNANASMRHLAFFHDGAGPALYATGGFTNIGGVPLRAIAKWDGQRWSPLGTGIAISVHSMTVYDDGRGPALYVVGAGSEAGGVAVRNIARWDGHEWSDVGGGTGGCASCPSVLYSAHVFDDGTGPGLYVGGYVGSAGGVPASGIARWDGKRWSALGPGVGGAYLDDMAVFDDGRGPSLFVGSVSSNAGGGVAPGIAQWVGCPNCYPDCDNDDQLNVNDFVCFSQKYAARDPYANCTVDAAIDVADFVCFMNRFAAGCGR